ncbi:MAG: hypothetical protein ABSG43_09880 [Solirubrobacteraceae bacterium]
MIAPRVTPAGHPVELAERYEFVTHGPIVIESDGWIGAAATITPGARIGHGSVVGAGAVVAKDVPPLTVVTGAGSVERKHLPRAHRKRVRGPSRIGPGDRRIQAGAAACSARRLLTQSRGGSSRETSSGSTAGVRPATALAR